MYEEQLSEDEKTIDHGGMKGTLNGIAGRATRPAGERTGAPGPEMKRSGARSERESQERVRQNERSNEGRKNRPATRAGAKRADGLK